MHPPTKDFHVDPFVQPPPLPRPSSQQHEVETAWFDAPRHRSASSRPRKSIASIPPSQVPPAPPIDDPIADDWFR